MDSIYYLCEQPYAGARALSIRLSFRSSGESPALTFRRYCLGFLCVCGALSGNIDCRAENKDSSLAQPFLCVSFVPLMVRLQISMDRGIAGYGVFVAKSII